MAEKYQVTNRDGEFAETATPFVGPGNTAPQRLCGDIMVAVTGTATEVVYRVERASHLADPAIASNYAPADAPPFDLTSNPSDGAEQTFYREPSIGWWRVRVLSIAGGTATINLLGKDA